MLCIVSGPPRRTSSAQGGHYILTVKNDQRTLHKQLKALPWKQVAVLATDAERGHGRIATRTLKATEVTAGIGFPHAVQVLQLTHKTRRHRGDRLHTEVVYAVTSLSAAAKPDQIASWLRGHWAIENRLH
jgi:predicted transposase YbfD/YdcC